MENNQSYKPATKKELLAMPLLKATEEMMARRGRHLWFYRAQKQGQVIEVAIFTQHGLKAEDKLPKYRVFLQPDRYVTYERERNIWRVATIEKLDYDSPWPQGYWRIRHDVYMDHRERQLIADFMPDTIDLSNVMMAIEDWQNNSRHRKELVGIDNIMSKVPDIPGGYDQWVVKEGFEQYLFYDAAKRAVTGYCHHCEQEVAIVKLKYNQLTTCPNCGWSVRMKSRKRGGNLREQESFGLLQTMKEGFVYRIFEAQRFFENGLIDEHRMGERYRITYDKEFALIKIYEWGRFKTTNTWRWCDVTRNGNSRGYEQEPAKTYHYNIRDIIAGTTLAYSAMDLFAEHYRYWHPYQYIKGWEKFRGVEQLVKCGFYKVAYEGTGYGLPGLIESSSARGIIGIGSYYSMLAGTDPYWEQIITCRALEGLGYRLSYNDVCFIAHECGVEFIRYFSITTPLKMIRYLRALNKLNRSYDKRQHVFRLYSDYLDMATKLGYDIRNTFILYPRDVKERHDQMAAEQREKDRALAKLKADERARHFAEMAKGWVAYEMEHKGLVVRVPKTVDDIRTEGNTLRHCVVNYIDRIIKGETNIAFIRKVDDPDTPYYTIEYNGGMVIQCRGKNNKATTKEVDAMVRAFTRAMLTVSKERES